MGPLNIHFIPGGALVVEAATKTHYSVCMVLEVCSEFEAMLKQDPVPNPPTVYRSQLPETVTAVTPQDD
jgi:hypothetical protein